MRAYLVPIIAVIAAAGLVGCATESQHDIRFFKGSGPDGSYGAAGSTPHVDQRYHVRIISVFQTKSDPASK